MSAPLSTIGGQNGFRAEIQGLRAVAIALVLIFHVWPESISGGYVGVDVFFVISGYLITRVLFQEYASTGRIDVARFYERRIRRLMPAATLVLLASALLLFLLPATQREDGAKSIIASALYVQNWWLSAQAVDYLAAESAPGLLNHFWSLAVEEQYYIFWPVMVFAVGWLFVRSGKTHARAFTVLVATVLICSLAYSIWLTETNPQRAYFSTFTRAWELAIGGFLAVTSGWREMDARWRNLLGLAGLAAILAAAFLYDTSTPFPGYAAALPTLGAAMIIVAGQSGSFLSAYRVMALKPMQVLGDVSYSLYLWHWPVIISYMALVGHSPGVIDGLALVAISFALAFTTKALFEDRYRHHGHSNSRRNAFMMAAGCIIASCLAGVFILRSVAWSAFVPSASEEVSKEMSSQRIQDNPGSAALWKGIEVNADAPLIPSLASIKDDLPAPYLQKCISRGNSHEVKECRYGKSGGIPVVLVGDAHALQWQPVLAALADSNEWDLRVLAKTGCVLGGMPIEVTGFDDLKQSACTEWENEVVDRLQKSPAKVAFVAQNARPKLAEGIDGESRERLLAEGLQRFSSKAWDNRTTVVFVRSVPNAGKECSDPSTLVGCSHSREDAIQKRDPSVMVSSLVGGKLLDPVDGICGGKVCDAVVGNVIVYRANGLLSATYARSMSEYIAGKVDAMKIFDLPLKVDLSAILESGSDMTALAMAAKRDNPDLYADGCHLDQVDTVPMRCEYGQSNANIKVVLAGDSHSAQWLPALQDLAGKRGWKIFSFTKSACTFSDTIVEVSGREYTSCTEWNKNVMEEIASINPDFLVMSQSRGHRAFGNNSPDESLGMLSDGLVSRWRKLHSMGIPVIAVEGTPWMDRDIPDCVSAANYVSGKCDTSLQSAFRLSDAVADASRKYPEASLVSVNDVICDDRKCRSVIDGKIIYRDRHHLTATFVRGHSDRIGKAADKVLN